MADEEIFDQVAKTDVDLTDELYLQTTGGGATLKAKVGNAFKRMFLARGRLASTTGGLKSGSVGFDDVNLIGTGTFDWVLSEAVDVGGIFSAQAIVTANTTAGGVEIAARMISTTTCRVKTSIAGVPTSVQHTLLIVDEG